MAGSFHAQGNHQNMILLYGLKGSRMGFLAFLMIFCRTFEKRIENLQIW